MQILGQSPKDPPLPQLRGDIQLNEAPPEPEGAPTWTLYDPSANKYYKIGWLEFECLSRFNKCRTISDLVARVTKETPLNPDADMVKALIHFLMHHNLLHVSGVGVSAHFESERAKKVRPLWEKILHGYLFFTLPIFKPEAFLKRTFPLVRPLFTRQFMTGVCLLLAYGIFLSLQRFDEISSTFMSYFNLEGVLLLAAATILVKIVHEMGHAWAATKYGVPVSVMGIAFIVMYPMLYTETTNAWKLKSRRDRLVIAAGGVMAEMALASVALILWHILTPGIGQSLCFMIAIVSLIASLVVNLNPLMRFDGYYMFADLVGYDNLQDRAFAFSRWRLRRALWGWDDPLPEQLPPEEQRFLAMFGFAVWVYRFFLYTGIALLVYHMFFQPLGLILMIVEYAFFIGLPMFREAKVWFMRREEIKVFTRGGVVAALAGFMIMLSLIPLDRSVEIPAVLHASSYTKLYSPVAARIDEIKAEQGLAVKKGDVLYRLSSEQLDYNISLIKQRLASLQHIKESSQASPGLARKFATIDSEIAASRNELQGYETIREQLIIRAPFDGVLRDMTYGLHVGQWVSGKLTLGLLVNDSQPVITGYVREQDSSRISAGARGNFYAEFSPFARYPVGLEQVDETAVSEVFWPELSSVHHGAIPAERDGHGVVRTLPRHTYYAVKMTVLQNGTELAEPPFVARGTVRLWAKPESVAMGLIKRAISVIIRESGF